MTVDAQVTINRSKAAVWAAITDIANAAAIISGIEKIEVIEKPTSGLVGLKWKETRMLFGKPATVEKVIIAGAENEFFTTESQDRGFVFSTYNRIWEGDDGTILRSSHTTTPLCFAALLTSLPMVFFKGVIKKAILQDLNDTKAAVERVVIVLATPHIALGSSMKDALMILQRFGKPLQEVSGKEHHYRLEAGAFRMALYPKGEAVGSVWYDDPTGRTSETARAHKVEAYLLRYGKLQNWERRLDNGWMHYWFNPVDRAQMAYGIHKDVIRFNQYQEVTA